MTPSTAKHGTFPVIALCSIVVGPLAYNSWTLNGGTFFISVDWPWLFRAEFSPWTSLLAPLPESIYNDRPVGAAVIRLLYEAFGFDQSRFQIVLLSIHAGNCALLYWIAAPHIGTARAAVAALLAATWFSTLDALTSASMIFDLLGATLCLATLEFANLAANARRPFSYNCAGVICYVLAIRTKEFAVGLVLVLFLSAWVLHRRRLLAAAKEVGPYLLVFAIYALRYGYLLLNAPKNTSDPYHLVLTPATVASSLEFFISAAFYRQAAGGLACLTILIALVVAVGAADARARRNAAFGFASFVVLLGPTLLLVHTDQTNHHRIYLCAPHFLLAFAIAALLGDRMRSIIPASVAIVTIAWVPFTGGMRRDVIAFQQEKSRINRAQFQSAVTVLRPLARGSTVVVDGVEAFFNPFSNPAGSSLAVAFKDATLAVVSELPEEELLKRFCAAPEPKRFLGFAGVAGDDVTRTMMSRCPD